MDYLNDGRIGKKVLYCIVVIVGGRRMQ